MEIAKQMLVQRMDSREVNDYIFMKLGTWEPHMMLTEMQWMDTTP